MSGKLGSRKRNSTWDRHLQREKNEVLEAINNKIQRLTYHSKSDVEGKSSQPNEFQGTNECYYEPNINSECGERYNFTR